MIDTDLIAAETPGELELRVQGWLAKGWDLDLHPVLAIADRLGQWIVHVPAGYEYRLIHSGDLASYKRDVKSLRGDGWGFHGPAVMWNGSILQWMCREKTDIGKSFGDVLEADMSYPRVERAESSLRLIPSPVPGSPPLLVEGGRVVVPSVA